MQTAIPVALAHKRIGVGRTKFYELLNQREIPSIKIGKRRLVRVAELDRWLDSQPTMTPAEAA